MFFSTSKKYWLRWLENPENLGSTKMLRIVFLRVGQGGQLANGLKWFFFSPGAMFGKPRGGCTWKIECSHQHIDLSIYIFIIILKLKYFFYTKFFLNTLTWEFEELRFNKNNNNVRDIIKCHNNFIIFQN